MKSYGNQHIDPYCLFFRDTPGRLRWSRWNNVTCNMFIIQYSSTHHSPFFFFIIVSEVTVNDSSNRTIPFHPFHLFFLCVFFFGGEKCTFNRTFLKQGDIYEVLLPPKFSPLIFVYGTFIF